MSQEVQILDKTFVPFISSKQLDDRVKDMADWLNEKFRGGNPLFLAILNGSFVFASDLFKKITLTVEITFVKLASYQGTSSTGNVLTTIGLDRPLNDRDVVLVEDIIDSGKTLHEFLPQLRAHGIRTLTVVSLLTKPEAIRYQIDIDLIGFEIDNRFVVGYGLDYDGYGRNLPAIYQLKIEE